MLRSTCMGIVIATMACVAAGCRSGAVDAPDAEMVADAEKQVLQKGSQMDAEFEVQKTEAQWRAVLTDREYYVLRQQGTETPFQNKYWDTDKPGVYKCAACGQTLFKSETKFYSSCGWPSFFKGIAENIETRPDPGALGMPDRTEVICSRCGSHLGHVFKDGPEPTGLRYCINSVALDLVTKQEQQQNREQEQNEA